MDFGHVLTAMVTPFDANGDVDLDATHALVQHLIDNGSDGLVVGGTTGESPTLTADEKLDMFRAVVQAAAGRVSVIAGSGSNNTRESINLTKQAKKTGVDGIMLVTPYYNKPSQEGLYQHFAAIAETTSLPVMLYNIPGRSVVHIEPETVVRLSQISNITAVKEAGGNLNHSTAMVRDTPEDFLVYSGEDGNTLPILAVGGTGVVSVASHIIGNEMRQMVLAYKQGNVQEASLLHGQLLPIMEGLFQAPSPAPVKTALNLSGVAVGSVRLPLVPLSEEETNRLQQVILVNKTRAIS